MDDRPPALALRPPARGAPDLDELATASAFTVWRSVRSTPKGLTEAEADLRLAGLGENALTPTVEVRAGAQLRTALASPFAGMLLALGAVLAVAGSHPSAALVLGIALASVALRLAEQVRSVRAMRSLRSRTTTTALVRRRSADGGDGRERDVPITDVVPGDVIRLAPGDLVPADVRLLDANDLLVDQSALTGELQPTPKHVGPGAGSAPPPDPTGLPAIGLAGTTVLRGTATAVVIATGAATRFHALSRPGPRPRSTADAGVREVSWALVRFMLVLVPIVLAVNGTITGDWATATTFAVAVAIGLTPELLPIIVTTTLTRGATRLRAAGALVTRLDGIQDLGGIDTLCLDKTGTLTEGRVVYARALDITDTDSRVVAHHAFLAAHFQSVPADPIDEALAELASTDEALLSDAVHDLVEELPFDHLRRRSTLILRDGEQAGDLLVTKGDPDVLLGLCSSIQLDGLACEFDEPLRERAQRLLAEHRRRGLRVLAVARRRVPRFEQHPERELTLLGFVGFVDPVREGTAGAVADAAGHGVTIKILTGDAPLVAERVARVAGIPIGAGAVLGSALDDLDDAQLGKLVERVDLFAGLTPGHKTRLVAALQRRGHSVGFVGDGVNDVDALRTADVGIALADGTEAARAAADLIVLRGDLTVLATAITEGRRTLAAATRYSTLTAGINLGNAASMVLASIFLPFLPMLPVQLILQNLLYNAVALAIPYDRVDPGQLRRPRRWVSHGLLRFMLLLGGLSTAFDLLTFTVVWHALGMDTAAEQQVFQSVWFIEGIASQVLVLLVLRPRGAPRPGPVITTAGVTAIAVAALLPMTAIGAAVDMVAVPLVALPWLGAIVVGYALAVRLIVPAYTRVSIRGGLTGGR